MGNIPLPALAIKPPQTPDIMGQYGNLLRLKAMQQEMAEAPVRQQILEQQQQAGALQLQQAQQAQKDQQTFRAAMSDPSMQGKTIGQIADALAQKGGLSQTTYLGLKKADIANRQANASLSTAELEASKNANAQLQTLHNNVQGMSDADVMKNWANIANQYDSTVGMLPQGAAAKMPKLDPNQPLTKQQLAQFGPMISMGNAYLDQEIARRKAAADAQTAETNASFGPSGPAADSKYRFLEAKVIAKQPLSDADKNWMEAYKKQKLLVPVISGQVREAGYASSRLYPVFDNATHQTLYVSANDVNAMRAENPSRYSPASYSPESIGQRDTTAYFTKGKGGQQLTAYNTALAHLDTLQTLASALNNGDIQAVNRIAQRFKQETGNPAPTNFEAAKNAMAGEVASALKASGATDQEIEKVDQTFGRAQSPEQLAGAINTYRSLLNSKAHQLQGQYSAGMQGKPNFQPPEHQNSGPMTITLPSGKKITID